MKFVGKIILCIIYMWLLVTVPMWCFYSTENRTLVDALRDQLEFIENLRVW